MHHRRQCDGGPCKEPRGLRSLECHDQKALADSLSLQLRTVPPEIVLRSRSVGRRYGDQTWERAFGQEHQPSNKYERRGEDRHPRRLKKNTEGCPDPGRHEDADHGIDESFNVEDEEETAESHRGQRSIVSKQAVADGFVMSTVEYCSSDGERRSHERHEGTDAGIDGDTDQNNHACHPVILKKYFCDSHSDPVKPGE